jgi:isocitrate lyase
VLVPIVEFIQKLIAVRMAADICGVPAVLVARTDADAAKLLTNDADPRDQEFLTGERTEEGFFIFRGGLPAAIARALAFAPYADMLWCETSVPSLKDARQFAESVHAQYPGKLLAYNCSPSFNWLRNLDMPTIAKFQKELGAMGYKFQFVTLAGFHAVNMEMFDLALNYNREGMAAYAHFQEREFEAERLHGYRAAAHQRFVGAGYFDRVMETISGGKASTTALKGSTEEAQFTVTDHPLHDQKDGPDMDPYLQEAK